LSRDLHSLLMSTFSRDIGMRPTADELLLHPFVLAHGASAEAVAAGHQGHLERQNAPPIVPQREATTLALKVRQFSTVEEAADQTLARQAIGLLGDDPDIAKGFQLESFRMPPCEEAVDTHGTRQEPPERNAKSGRCGDYDDENRVELSSRLPGSTPDSKATWGTPAEDSPLKPGEIKGGSRPCGDIACPAKQV